MDPKPLRFAVLGFLLLINIHSWLLFSFSIARGALGNIPHLVFWRGKKQPRFIAFAHVHGVNTFIAADFKLVMMSLNAELGSEAHSWLLPAGMSWLQDTVTLNIIMSTHSGWAR